MLVRQLALQDPDVEVGQMRKGAGLFHGAFPLEAIAPPIDRSRRAVSPAPACRGMPAADRLDRRFGQVARCATVACEPVSEGRLT
jgi:hypothetical protein